MGAGVVTSLLARLVDPGMEPYRDPDTRRQQMERFLRQRAESDAAWRVARQKAEAALAHKLARREERERNYLPRQDRGLLERLEDALAPPPPAGRRGRPA